MDKWFFFLRFLQISVCIACWFNSDFQCIFFRYFPIFNRGYINLCVCTDAFSQAYSSFTVFYHSIFIYDEEGELCYLQM